MRTERLFDQDVRCLAFTANVLRCEGSTDRWLVELDRTAFFPEGGGQLPDRGTLNGIPVLDVHEKDGCIVHTVAEPIAEGSEVSGCVDADHRMDMMQQHTGEHIFTGIAHGLYGVENVGFHIGPTEVTVDFNIPLTAEQINEVERLANEVIWRDLPVVCRFPSAEELEMLPYRSKKALTGAIRIVSIEGVDICACCGTHVESTGKVGQIKIAGYINYKGGIRFVLHCGKRALTASNEAMAEVRAVSRALSAKQGTLEESVKRLLAERDALNARCGELAMTLFQLQAAEQEKQSIRIVCCDSLPAAQLRKAAGQLADGARFAMVCIAKPDGTTSFALSSATEDVRPAAKMLTETFGGKGGGPKDMVQGVLQSGNADAWRSALDAL